MRGRIVDAAITYLRAFGSEKLNVREVAQLAGVGRATVHKHFGTRDGLLEAAQTCVEEQMLEMLSIAASIDGPLDQRAAAVAICIRRARADRSSATWFGFFNPIEEAAMLVTQASTHIRHLTALFRPLVIDAQASGEIRAGIDVDHASEWMARMCLTFVLDPAELDIDNEETVARFFHMQLAGLIARDPTDDHARQRE